jgi:N-acetylneuraminate lyase
MNANPHLTGLIAATHTPFDGDGSVALDVIESQARHLAANGLSTVFIGGTTGEYSSLTTPERLALAQRWSEVARGTDLRVIVHVGSNCLEDSRVLAAQAQELGSLAISALAPSYFKPVSVAALTAWCAEIAAAAPALPFYYYHIPSLTGVNLRMTEFLEIARERVPTLVGMKFTNPDLMSYLQCLRMGNWDIPWGIDEWLLGALATGARAAVGSSFNFAAPVYQRIIRAFERGDFQEAREWQYRSTQLIGLLSRYGYMGAAKTVMEMLGVKAGAPRLPNLALGSEEKSRLAADLEALGFYAWLDEAIER